MRHFLDLDQFDGKTLQAILDSAKTIKRDLKKGKVYEPLKGKHLAMIFEKPSTRTRVSFEAGIQQLGGHSVILDSSTSQLSRGESIPDMSRVLSRYVDLIMIRCFEHSTLLDLAKYAEVPVINGLSNTSHPCQIMADIMTYEEHRESIHGKTVAWIGDGNNVTTSWIHASARLGFRLNIATPEQLRPNADIVEWANKNGGNVYWTTDPEKAVKQADLVTTDTWVSMGDTDIAFRHKLLDPYQVTEELMKEAHDLALFMHCLPAHRGEEVTGAVIDGPQSVIFDEAENRLHVQKAIMLWCLGIA